MTIARTWTTVVDADELAASLDRDDLVIVDCRFSLAVAQDPAQTGEAAYRRSHLPDARYAHLDRDLSAPKASAAADAGRHPWPDADAFCATLGAWGIRRDTQVVAYDGGDGAFAARLWCLLRALGHDAVAVLDGGRARWAALKLPIDAHVVVPQRQTYRARFDDPRLLDAAQVQAHLAAGGLLVDARAAERFRGEVEPIDRVAGHVPGAVNRPYADNLIDGRFKSASQLAEEFTALLGAHAPDDVVTMCGSGVTACHHLLAMQHAGLHGARLFTGSWSGWIGDAARPVATGAA